MLISGACFYLMTARELAEIIVSVGLAQNLAELDSREVRDLFARYGVLNQRELASRYEVYLEQYFLSIAVEARTAPINKAMTQDMSNSTRAAPATTPPTTTRVRPAAPTRRASPTRRSTMYR